MSSRRTIDIDKYIKRAMESKLKAPQYKLISNVFSIAFTRYGTKLSALESLQFVNPEIVSTLELRNRIYSQFFACHTFGTDKSEEFLKQLVKLKNLKLFDQYEYLKFCSDGEVRRKKIMRNERYSQDFTNFMVYFKYLNEQDHKNILEGTLES